MKCNRHEKKRKKKVTFFGYETVPNAVAQLREKRHDIRQQVAP
jgi:hypothetical protein